MRAAVVAVEGPPRPRPGSQQRAVMGLLWPVYCTPAPSQHHAGHRQKINSNSKQNNSTSITEKAIKTVTANNDSIIVVTSTATGRMVSLVMTEMQQPQQSSSGSEYG